VIVFYIMFNGILTVPWVRTSKDRARKMLELADLHPGETIIDLGCGDGSVCFVAANEFKAKAIGVERLRLLVWLAKISNRIKKTENAVDIKREDLFSTDLSKADVLAVYLFREFNKRLEPRIKGLCKPGARVVSRTFSFPNLRLIEQISYKNENYYLYQV